MGYAQGTINPMAVLRGRWLWVYSIDDIVTRIAEVVRAPAAIESNGAAVHALPIDLIISVFLAFGRTRAKL